MKVAMPNLKQDLKLNVANIYYVLNGMINVTLNWSNNNHLFVYKLIEKWNRRQHHIYSYE